MKIVDGSTLFRRILCSAVILLGAGTSQTTLANSYNFCVGVETDLENVNFGEDYFTQVFPNVLVPYIKVKVTKGAEVIVNTTYAGSGGCISFTHATTGEFRLEITSEMRIPRTDNSSDHNIVRVLNGNGDLVGWNVFHTFSGTTGTQVFTLPQSNRTNLIAIADWAYRRHSDGLVNKITEVRDSFGVCETDNSCNGTYAGSTATVYINPIHNKRKFLIGHELGHSFIAHWFADNPAPAQLGGQGSLYSRNEGGTACEWSGAGAHAMHSKEYSSGALLEAFPHYYSTYLFNDATETDAAFWYYKDGTGITEVDMESGPTGGATAYMEATCTGSDALRSVELDWARQLWDFRTNSGDIPSNYALTRMIKNGLTSAGWDMEDAWPKLQTGMDVYDTANATDFRTRWDTFGAANGIDH